MTRKITPAQLDKIEAAAKKVMPGGWWVVALDPLLNTLDAIDGA